MTIRLRDLPWDSEILGMRMARLEVEEGAEAPESLYAEVLEAIGNRPELRMIILKVPAQMSTLVDRMVKLGGDLVDMEYIFRLRSRPPHRPVPEDLVVEARKGCDPTPYLPLASEMGKSRLFKDERIGYRKAEVLWRYSIANHCRGRADGLVTADVNGKPAGLAIMNRTSEGELSVFLVGVLPGFRGRGVAGAMMQKVVEVYGDVPVLTVETQPENTAACRLYRAAGFELDEARYILHLWDLSQVANDA